MALFPLAPAAAKPPVGKRPLGQSGYDRLVAIAGEIVSWGMRSDEHYYSLDAIRLTMLRSDRLVVDRPILEHAQDDFMRSCASVQLQEAASHFALHWDPLPVVESKKAALDQACATEFPTQ